VLRGLDRSGNSQRDHYRTRQVRARARWSRVLRSILGSGCVNPENENDFGGEEDMDKLDESADGRDAPKDVN